MIGYGIVNSSVHEFCINQIIINFFNRSSFVLAPYYMSIKILIGHLDKSKNQKTYAYFFQEKKTTKNDLEDLKNQKKIKVIDNLYELFLLEEYKLSTKKTFSDTVTIDEIKSNEILFKYFCSANIILDKDYNFDLKTTDEAIKEGYAALKELFTNLFIEFLNNSKITTSSSSGTKLFSIQTRLLYGKAGIYGFKENFSSYYKGLYDIESETKKPAPLVNEEDIPEQYKNLKTKLDSIAKAIGDDFTNLPLLKNTLNSLTPQQKCYFCSRRDVLWTLKGGSKVSAIAAIADDLSGKDLDTYLYNILKCSTDFGYKNKEGSVTGDSQDKCIEYFEPELNTGTNFGLPIVSDGVFEEFYNFFLITINKKYTDYREDLKNINSNIIKFYTDQSFLEQRNNYIDLLNNQINVLEGS